MRSSVIVLRRLLVAALLLGVAGLVWLPTVGPADQATAVSLRRDACGKILKKPNGGTWACSFVDNFGGGALDRDKWIVQESTRSRYSTGLTCYRDSSDNIRVSRGKLRLITRKRGLFLCGANRAFLTRFTGGMVGTRGHFSQTYGRFEIRAKFPTARHSGIHGGFWMNPVDKIYGPWPASGEMDVAEWWSRYPHLVMPSLHYNGREKQLDSGLQCKVHDVTRFHTYRLVWRPQIMRFFIDGRQCFARRWVPDAPQHRPQPFDHPFSMILNMGVTTYQATKETRITDQTEFPSTFVVDYAKAWR